MVLNFFNCNEFGHQSFIDLIVFFFNFLSLYFIFILDFILILLIMIVATMIFSALRAPPSPVLGRQRRAVKKGVCFIAIKIMTIIIRSHHLVLRLLRTYWSVKILGKGTCCARGRRITSSALYIRQTALLFDCFS